MKKLILTVLAFTFVSGALAQEFPDVPAGSYAEEAVARLADLGIIIGFPDGTFRGNEAFNRYQAALVVTRLLDLIEGEFLSADDLDTVRNALQELASDVAANQEAVAALEEAIAGADGADAAAVEQLQTQLDALRVELDTANAAAQASAALEQQVASNTSQIDQLSELLTILNEDIAAIAAGTGGEVDTSFLADIERSTGDVANLREFVVLLRRDQVASSERIATLEASDAAQDAQLEDLETRVSALEEGQVAFTGSIGLEYEVSRLSGAEVPFDVDRIFGLGLDREEAPSYFSSGEQDLNSSGTINAPGERAQDRQDIENQKGSFGPVLELNVDFAAERGLSPESGLNTFESTVVLELVPARVLNDNVDVADPEFDFTDPANYFQAYVFRFSSVTATLGPIGADPINFYFGQEPGADFSAYVFESLGPGFRAEIGTPDFLAFLQPTLEVAYGVYNQGGDSQTNPVELPDDDAPQLSLNDTPVANPWTDAYYRGVRGTLTPFSGEGFAATGGFSVGQISGNAADNADAANDNVDVLAFGLDGQVNLSIFNVEFEYAQNMIGDGARFQQGNTVLRNDDGETVDFDGNVIDTGIPVAQEITDSTVVYADLTVDIESLGVPLLRSLGANYRSIPQFWYGLKYDVDTYPWALDQEGFGAEATAGLSIFNLTGFVDSYTIAAEATETVLADGSSITGNDVDAYGVRAGVEVFRAVEVYGFYNIVTLNGTAVEGLSPGQARRDNDYAAGLGIGVEHDGEASNALVPGLNFNFAYDITQQNIAAANVDTEVTVAGFELSPYVSYTSDSSAAEFSDDVVELRAGTGVATEPLDIFLQPSLAANVNYRNAVHSDVSADVATYTADVLQYSVGVEFNEFLFAESSLGVRYGSYTGTNIEINPNVNGSGDFASDISDGDEPNTGTQSTNGYEIVWNYYGLEFAYGAYLNSNPAASPNPGDTGGQSFSIQYTVDF